MDFSKKFFKKMSARFYVIYCAIIGGGILIDQVSKAIVSATMKNGDIPLWDGVFHLKYYENRGAAFGMLSGEGERWIFIIISIIAIIGLLLYLYSGRVPTPLYGTGISLIISGGIANMIDRIFLGYVVDFLYFKLIDFAIFNIADSCVCIGAALVVIALLKDIINSGKNNKKQGKDENAADS